MDSYSEIMDVMGNKKTVRLPFPLDCELGEVYDGRIIFRPVARTLESTTIEVIDFKKSHGGSSEEADAPRVVPAPS